MNHIMYERINCILAEWDPLDLKCHIVYDEYIGYVPKIISAIPDREKVIESLKYMLENLGIDRESFNEELLKELEGICDKILYEYRRINHL